MHPATGRVLLAGRLDRDARGSVTAACALLAAGGAPVWVVDLAAVESCDAAGLRALAGARCAAEDAGADLHAAGARPFLRRLLPLVAVRDVPAGLQTAPGTACARGSDPPHGAVSGTRLVGSPPARAGARGGAPRRPARRVKA